jgi:hypothetical protein
MPFFFMKKHLLLLYCIYGWRNSVLSRFHFSGGRIEIPGGRNQTSEWALHPKQPKMYSYFIFPGGRRPPGTPVDKSLWRKVAKHLLMSVIF